MEAGGAATWRRCLERTSSRRSPEIIASAIFATVSLISAWPSECAWLQADGDTWKTGCAIWPSGWSSRRRTTDSMRCARNLPPAGWWSRETDQLQRGYILITGGAGFIGTNVARSYLGEDQPVHIFDNLSRPGVEQNITELQRELSGTGSFHARRRSRRRRGQKRCKYRERRLSSRGASRRDHQPGRSVGRS